MTTDHRNLDCEISMSRNVGAIIFQKFCSKEGMNVLFSIILLYYIKIFVWTRLAIEIYQLYYRLQNPTPENFQII